jgi:hypothetical protein
MLLKQLLIDETIITYNNVFETKFREIYEASLPKFPGEELRINIDNYIKETADLLLNFAKKMLPFAKQHNYKTAVLDKIIDNPEKAAKQLLTRYTASYKDNAFTFKLNDILKDINLDI